MCVAVSSGAMVLDASCNIYFECEPTWKSLIDLRTIVEARTGPRCFGMETLRLYLPLDTLLSLKIVEQSGSLGRFNFCKSRERGCDSRIDKRNYLFRNILGNRGDDRGQSRGQSPYRWFQMPKVRTKSLWIGSWKRGNANHSCNWRSDHG